MCPVFPVTNSHRVRKVYLNACSAGCCFPASVCGCRCWPKCVTSASNEVLWDVLWAWPRFQVISPEHCVTSLRNCALGSELPVLEVGLVFAWQLFHCLVQAFVTARNSPGLLQREFNLVSVWISQMCIGKCCPLEAFEIHLSRGSAEYWMSAVAFCIWQLSDSEWIYHAILNANIVPKYTIIYNRCCVHISGAFSCICWQKLSLQDPLPVNFELIFLS